METNIDKICRSPYHCNPSSIFNCPTSDNYDDFEFLESHYDGDGLCYSSLLFFKPDNLFCFQVVTTDGMYLNFWFAKRSYISLYYKSLVTPHSFSYFKSHFPFALLSRRVALANRPYYMKGGKK